MTEDRPHTGVRRLSQVTIAVLITSIVVYLVYVTEAVMNGRSLYADGSFFFIQTLLNRDQVWPAFDDIKHIRLFANLVNQLPMAVGLKAGIVDLKVLRLLFGLPLFFGERDGDVGLSLVDRPRPQSLGPSLSVCGVRAVLDAF